MSRHLFQWSVLSVCIVASLIALTWTASSFRNAVAQDTPASTAAPNTASSSTDMVLIEEVRRANEQIVDVVLTSLGLVTTAIFLFLGLSAYGSLRISDRERSELLTNIDTRVEALRSEVDSVRTTNNETQAGLTAALTLLTKVTTDHLSNLWRIQQIQLAHEFSKSISAGEWADALANRVISLTTRGMSPIDPEQDRATVDSIEYLFSQAPPDTQFNRSDLINLQTYLGEEYILPRWVGFEVRLRAIRTLVELKLSQ